MWACFCSSVLRQWESRPDVVPVNDILLVLLPMQSGVCGCERGYTEVMTTHGFLDYCTRTPGLDSSKKADVKTNSGRAKPRPSQGQDLFNEWTLRPIGPGTQMITQWQLVWNNSWITPVKCSCSFLIWVEKELKQVFLCTDGRVKLWVYAVTAVGFILILFIIALTFLLWYVPLSSLLAAFKKPCKKNKIQCSLLPFCSTPSKTSKTSSPAPQKPLTLAYDGDMDM